MNNLSQEDDQLNVHLDGARAAFYRVRHYFPLKEHVEEVAKLMSHGVSVDEAIFAVQQKQIQTLQRKADDETKKAELSEIMLRKVEENQKEERKEDQDAQERRHRELLCVLQGSRGNLASNTNASPRNKDDIDTKSDSGASTDQEPHTQPSVQADVVQQVNVPREEEIKRGHNNNDTEEQPVGLSVNCNRVAEPNSGAKEARMVNGVITDNNVGVWKYHHYEGWHYFQSVVPD